MCDKEKPGMGIYLFPEPAEIECRDDGLSCPRCRNNEVLVMVMDRSFCLKAFKDLFLEGFWCNIEEVWGALISGTSSFSTDCFLENCPVFLLIAYEFPVIPVTLK